MKPGVTLTAIPGLPDFQDGDDLAAILGDALEGVGCAPVDGDVLCVAQKVFSKVEGCIVPLDGVTPGKEAQEIADRLNKDPRKVEVVLGESARVVRAFRHEGQNEGVMICEHHQGFISANAGVDESNFAQLDAVMTLPPDPDQSAARLGEALQQRFGVTLGIVMTDTFGRPWRLGQVNVAVGLFQVPARVSERGEQDGWGRPLAVTEPALADELAAAAGLVMGKSARTPVVLVRGLKWQPGDSKIADLIRSRQEDMFK
ncbi:MAG: coenzyme F420-0:L-glutamate ligase [Pseudomonadota bacterium]